MRGFGMRGGWLYAREEILWFVRNNDAFIWNINIQILNQRGVLTEKKRPVSIKEFLMYGLTSGKTISVRDKEPLLRRLS